jgi:hypothetical protein
MIDQTITETIISTLAGVPKDTELYTHLKNSINKVDQSKLSPEVYQAFLAGLQSYNEHIREYSMLEAINKSLTLQIEIAKQNQVKSLQQQRISKDGPGSLFNDLYSTCSQNEEDSLIDAIFTRIGKRCGTAWEFGVGAGIQNNTAKQLLGGSMCFWNEINVKKYEFIKSHFARSIKSGKLVLSNVPVTPETVNELSSDMGVPEEIDLLSVDVDGDDFFIVDALERIRPLIIVCEYNARIPPDVALVGERADYSSYDPERYIGCSLLALSEMLDRKGYLLVATNLCGLNAFFVKKEFCLNGAFVRPGDVLHHYHPALHHLGFGEVWSKGPKPNFLS